jgi:hypothetical protein
MNPVNLELDNAVLKWLYYCVKENNGLYYAGKHHMDFMHLIDGGKDGEQSEYLGSLYPDATWYAEHEFESPGFGDSFGLILVGDESGVMVRLRSMPESFDVTETLKQVWIRRGTNRSNLYIAVDALTNGYIWSTTKMLRGKKTRLTTFEKQWDLIVGWGDRLLLLKDRMVDYGYDEEAYDELVGSVLGSERELYLRLDEMRRKEIT